ncbi:MAG TPA: OsmC family protein [Sphingomicrobium sp.]
MASTTVDYRLLPGTRASVGLSGTRSIIADRPDGKAGGMGLGLNGGELLAFAIGGCFCNDLQVLADEMGLVIADLQLSVTLEFAGSPSRTTGAQMIVACSLEDGSDPAELIERAKALTNIGNSVRDGIPLSISRE